MRIKQGLQTVLNARQEVGAGVALDVSNYRVVCYELATTGSASGTIKFAISGSQEKPDFNSPPSYTNRYSYVQVVDLQNDSSIAGNTGIVLTGTDVVRNYEVNTNFLIKWICPVITAYSAGTFDLVSDAVNDYTR